MCRLRLTSAFATTFAFTFAFAFALDLALLSFQTFRAFDPGLPSNLVNRYGTLELSVSATLAEETNKGGPVSLAGQQ